MIKRLRVGLTVLSISTSVLNIENDQTTFFKILALILDVDDDQTASSGLDEVFRISALILNVKNDEPGSIRLTCLVLVVVSSGH